MKTTSVSKWLSILLLMMVAGFTSAFAQTLTIADFTIKSGDTKDIAITLTPANGQTVFGVQTDLTLCEGLTAESNPMYNGVTVSSRKLSSGAIRIVLLDTEKGEALQTGDIITMTVKAADTFKSGNITLTNTRLTISTAGDEVKAADATAKVTLEKEPIQFDPAKAIVNPSFELSEAATEELVTANQELGTDYSSTGWKLATSSSWCNSAVLAYGSETMMNSVKAPAIAPEGMGLNAMGFTVGWGGQQYYQSAEPITLPIGEYVLLAYTYNANPDAQQMESKLGFILSEGDAIVSETKSFSSGEWTVDYVTITLTDNTEGVFQVGGKAINGGSGSNAKVFFDGLTLTDANGLATAQELVRKANEAIAAALAEEKLQAALVSLEELKATAAQWDTESYLFANPQKLERFKASLTAMPTSIEEVEDAATAIWQTYRAYVESNAMAEGVENASNMTELIQNPLAEDDTNFWTAAGKVGIRSNEPLTDSNGNKDYKYFDSDQWGDNSWDISLSQEIELPAGTYLLTVASRASVNLTSFCLFAGEEKKEMKHTGNSGETFDNGWNDAFLVFEMTESGTISIGVQGIAESNHQWMSFTRFRLASLQKTDPAEDPLLKQAIAELEKEIENANTMVESATEDAYGLEELKAAIETAKSALKLTSASEVKAATETLKAAEDSFVKTNAEQAQLKELREKLTDIINTAKALAADENKTNGKDELNTAIQEAEAALANSEQNAESLESQIEKLNAAIEAFQKANYYAFDGVAYIIDVKTGKFIAAGHKYGTQAIVNDLGLDQIFATNPETGKVTIDTRIYNGDSKHFLGSNLYTDSPAYEWALLKQDIGFFITDGSQYISIDEEDNLVMSETPRKWNIVTAEIIQEQRLGELATASMANPMNATFLLQNPNFNRNDQRVEAWNISDDCTNSNLNGGNQLNNCAESYHSVFTISQTVTGVPAGVYQLTAQGFYRQDDNVEEAAPVFFINDATAEVPVRTGEENNMSKASESFTAGLYTIEPIEVVVGDDGELTVGVMGTAVSQWVIFDNFQLTYFGKAQEKVVRLALTLNEYPESVKTGDNFNVTVTVKNTGTEDLENVPVVAYVNDAEWAGSTVTIENLIANEETTVSLPVNNIDLDNLEVIPASFELKAVAIATETTFTSKAVSISYESAAIALQEAIDELKKEIESAEAFLNGAADNAQGIDDLKAAIETAKNANPTTVEDAKAATEALKAAVQAFASANMLAYQKYLIQNVATAKFWGAANNWGTRASLIAYPEYVKLVPQPDGTYFLESQVNNGGEQYYFGGDYMDTGSPVALTIKMNSTPAGYMPDNTPLYSYTIANAAGEYYGYDGQSTILGKNIDITTEEGLANASWLIIPLDDAKKMLAYATAEEPADATFLIEDHDFGRNNRYANQWNMEASNKNLSGGNNTNNCAESFHSVFTLSQTLADAPAGVYALTAQGFYRQDGEDNTNLPVFYANDETQTFPLKTGTENSMSQASESFSAGLYTIEPIYVKVEEGGQLTIGARLEENTSLWCIWDNFTLKYYGKDADLEQVKNASLFALVKELRDKVGLMLFAQEVEVETVVNALQTAYDESANVTNADEANAAIKKLTAALDRGEASIIAKNILPKMKELTESTNVYTEEAYEEYYGQWYQKYEEGTLTKVEAASLQAPTIVTGWHANITCDNFLLSAWDTNPDFQDAAYYINTWSVEGENDGSEFKVPFFEYWTGDANALGERVLTATMEGLNPGRYIVKAWVRVRQQNGAEGAPKGIALRANNGETVDVTAGDRVGETQFFLNEFKAMGVVGQDGKLKIQFIVAADNNISWLSFKNVAFEQENADVFNAYTELVNEIENAMNILDNTLGATMEAEEALVEAIVEAEEIAYKFESGENVSAEQLTEALQALLDAEQLFMLSTGISELQANKMAIEGYTLGGQKVRMNNGKLRKGLYIINGRKTIVK